MLTLTLVLFFQPETTDLTSNFVMRTRLNHTHNQRSADFPTKQFTLRKNHDSFQIWQAAKKTNWFSCTTALVTWFPAFEHPCCDDPIHNLREMKGSEIKCGGRNYNWPSSKQKWFCATVAQNHFVQGHPQDVFPATNEARASLPSREFFPGNLTGMHMPWCATVQASGLGLFCVQASGFRLQASGMGLFYIRVNVKALVTGSITKWLPNSTSWHDQDQDLSTVLHNFVWRLPQDISTGPVGMVPTMMDRDRSADMRTRRHGHETSHEFHGMRFKNPECFNYAGSRPI
jgi:hypothetical protein